MFTTRSVANFYAASFRKVVYFIFALLTYGLLRWFCLKENTILDRFNVCVCFVCLFERERATPKWACDCIRQSNGKIERNRIWKAFVVWLFGFDLISGFLSFCCASCDASAVWKLQFVLRRVILRISRACYIFWDQSRGIRIDWAENGWRGVLDVS